MAKQIQGTIIRFGHKGYGFIMGKDGFRYFLHKSQIKTAKDIKAGDQVVFIADEEERGKFATEVDLFQSVSAKKQTHNRKLKPANKNVNINRALLVICIISIITNIVFVAKYLLV